MSHFDENGLIISDSGGGAPPGSYGDSMAETGRYFCLFRAANPNVELDQSVLARFKTSTGSYVRHPSLILYNLDKSWLPSSDQMLPYFLACPRAEQEKIFDSIMNAGWRTPDGNIGLPTLIATAFSRQLGRAIWQTDWPVLLEAMILRFLPFRWSDDKKWFERASLSATCKDYLNFAILLLTIDKKDDTMITWLARKVISPEDTLKAVVEYYKDEPIKGVDQVGLWQKVLIK